MRATQTHTAAPLHSEPMLRSRRNLNRSPPKGTCWPADRIPARAEHMPPLPGHGLVPTAPVRSTRRARVRCGGPRIAAPGAGAPRTPCASHRAPCARASVGAGCRFAPACGRAGVATKPVSCVAGARLIAPYAGGAREHGGREEGGGREEAGEGTVRHGAPGRGRALRGIGSAHGALAYTRVCRCEYVQHKMIMTLGRGSGRPSRCTGRRRAAHAVCVATRAMLHVRARVRGAVVLPRVTVLPAPPCHGARFVCRATDPCSCTAARAPYGGVQCGTVRLAVAARCAVGRRSCMRDPGQRGCDALPACAAGAATMFARRGVHQKLCPFGTLLVQLGPQAQS